jgi:hypothetical protein
MVLSSFDQLTWQRLCQSTDEMFGPGKVAYYRAIFLQISDRGERNEGER